MSNTPANNPHSFGDDSSFVESNSEETDPSAIEIELIVDSGLAPSRPPESQLRRALILTALRCGCNAGELGLRICSDESIHSINRSHLGHDYPTDVVSFGYGFQPPQVEGELIVSIDTANSKAADLRIATGEDWSTEDELLLYVIHGTLHICGMDDDNPDDRAEMRSAELVVLRQLGIDGRPDVESAI